MILFLAKNLEEYEMNADDINRKDILGHITKRKETGIKLSNS